MDYKANDTKCNKEYDSKEQESTRGIMQCDARWFAKHLKEYVTKKFYLNDIGKLCMLPYTLMPDMQVLEHFDTATNAWYNPYGEKIAVFVGG